MAFACGLALPAYAAQWTQTISFAGPTDQYYGDTATLTASAYTGMEVSFADTTPSVCTVTGNTVVAISTGFCTVRATQPGDSTTEDSIAAANTVYRTFAVNPRPVNVAADSFSVVYGSAMPTLTYTVNGLLDGDTLAGSPVRSPGTDVGRYTISLGSLHNSLYSIHFLTASLAITAKPLTITVNPVSKIYGDADPALTYTVDAVDSLIPGDYLVGSLQRDTGSVVGKYGIKRHTLDNSNYTINFIDDSLTIAQRPVTVTADAHTVVWGDVAPALTYSTNNLAPGDLLTGSLYRESGDTVGVYAILGDLLANSNYNITYVGANYRITSRPVHVTANALTKTYGNDDPALTFVATGLAPSGTLAGELARAAGENAGKYAINKGNIDTLNPNLTITFVGDTLTIAKRALTVTATKLSKVYGAVDPALTFDTDSLIDPDTLTGALTRDAGKNVGDYLIRVGTLANPNYSINYVGDTLSITPKPLTIVADGLTKVYGYLDPTLTYKIDHTDTLVTGDKLTGALVRDTGSSVGSYAILQSTLGAGATNYDIAYVPAYLAITPRPITITADSTLTKVYGATDPVLTYTVVGKKIGDVINGVLVRDTGESASIYAINQGTIDTVNNPNYQITFHGKIFRITKKPITVTADTVSKVYGSPDPTLTYTITVGAIVLNDTLTGSIVRDAGNNVGSYAIKVGSLAASTNYTMTFVSKPLKILAKALRIMANPINLTYGDPIPAVLTYTIDAVDTLAPGDVLTGALVRVNPTYKKVGRYPILNPSTGGLYNKNYLITYFPDTLVIVKKDLIVTADSLTKIYGAADPRFTFTIDATDGLVAGESLAGAFTRDPGTTIGTYAINAGNIVAMNTNYNVTFNPGSLTILPKPITVTVNAQTKYYGAADPVLSYKVSGLVGHDALAGSLFRDEGETIGLYNIYGDSLADSNYTVTCVNKTLKIKPKPIKVIADTLSKIYGDDDPTLTYTIVPGLAFSDAFDGTLTRAVGELAGSYKVSQGTIADSNYAITYISHNFKIKPRHVNVVADPITVTYGYHRVAGFTGLPLTYTVDSLVGSDSLSGSLVRKAGYNVGSYYISKGTLGSKNYSVSYVGDSVHIVKKALNVTANAIAKTYGAAEPKLTWVADSLLPRDALTGALVRAAGTGIGTYSITQGTLRSANYDISFTGNDFTINQKAVTITVNTLTKVYGATDPRLTYKAVGLVGKDTLAGALARADGETVGTYPIDIGTVDDPNYVITFVTKPFKIVAKALRVTAVAQTKVAGDADPELTYTTVGLVGSDALDGSLSRVAGEAVGAYVITRGTIANSNYAITYVPSKLTITAVPKGAKTMFVDNGNAVSPLAAEPAIEPSAVASAPVMASQAMDPIGPQLSEQAPSIPGPQLQPQTQQPAPLGHSKTYSLESLHGYTVVRNLQGQVIWNGAIDAGGVEMLKATLPLGRYIVQNRETGAFLWLKR